jgi:Fe2+ transport system protein FeoA
MPSLGYPQVKIQGGTELKTLNDLTIGQKAVIKRITGDVVLRKRLLVMGVVPGTEVVIENVAPLGDPVDVALKGFHLSLRREEARNIDVEVV